jgi:hypothetical protein
MPQTVSVRKLLAANALRTGSGHGDGWFLPSLRHALRRRLSDWQAGQAQRAALLLPLLE